MFKGAPPISSPNSKVAIGYAVQQTRIQITKDWRDACVNQEIEESQKLERFIEEERARAHQIAYSLKVKQEQTEGKIKRALDHKKQMQEEGIRRNKEKALQAGNKAVALAAGNMDRYEKKAALIKQKEIQREKERQDKIKAKEIEFQRR